MGKFDELYESVMEENEDILVEDFAELFNLGFGVGSGYHASKLAYELILLAIVAAPAAGFFAWVKLKDTISAIKKRMADKNFKKNLKIVSEKLNSMPEYKEWLTSYKKIETAVKDYKEEHDIKRMSSADKKMVKKLAKESEMKAKRLLKAAINEWDYDLKEAAWSIVPGLKATLTFDELEQRNG